MSKFRKKPITVEARQFTINMTTKEFDALCGWCGGFYRQAHDKMGDDFACIVVPTLEGEHVASPGDWIIKGIAGQFYPCKPDIFEQTYEPAD